MCLFVCKFVQYGSDATELRNPTNSLPRVRRHICRSSYNALWNRCTLVNATYQPVCQRPQPEKLCAAPYTCCLAYIMMRRQSLKQFTPQLHSIITLNEYYVFFICIGRHGFRPLKVCFFGIKNRVLSRDPNNVWLRSNPKPLMCSDNRAQLLPPRERADDVVFEIIIMKFRNVLFPMLSISNCS